MDGFVVALIAKVHLIEVDALMAVLTARHDAELPQLLLPERFV